MEYLTRAVVIPFDPSALQDQLLRSYAGPARRAHNWVLDEVRANLDSRATEREDGVCDDDLTPSLRGHFFTFSPRFNSVKGLVAPWHPNVTRHAWETGIKNACSALSNFSDSKNGKRAGKPVGFARHQLRHSKVSITFTDLRHQLGWLVDDRHHVRLVLTRYPTEPLVTRHREALGWIHTTVSTRRLYGQVRDHKVGIQKVTISFSGGRWQAALMVRYLVAPTPRPIQRLGDVVDVDFGVRHLATLSLAVEDFTDEFGLVKKPRHLKAIAGKLAKVDRAIARCQKKSKNRAKLVRCRARLYGPRKRTRDLELHPLTTIQAGSLDAVVLEDLSVTSMTKRFAGDGRKGRRRNVFDAGFVSFDVSSPTRPLIEGPRWS